MAITIRQHDCFLNDTEGFDVLSNNGNIAQTLKTLLGAIAFAQGVLAKSDELDGEGYQQIILQLDPAVVAFDTLNTAQMAEYENGQDYQQS